jgi:hypothetical protein
MQNATEGDIGQSIADRMTVPGCLPHGLSLTARPDTDNSN